MRSLFPFQFKFITWSIKVCGVEGSSGSNQIYIHASEIFCVYTLDIGILIFLLKNPKIERWSSCIFASYSIMYDFSRQFWVENTFFSVFLDLCCSVWYPLATCICLSWLKFLKIQFLSYISHIQVFNSHRWLVATVLEQMENNSIIIESSVWQQYSRSWNVEE